jgi:hypothetical protein
MRAAAILVLAVFLARPAPAEACSCAAPGPPCSVMFLSTVFVGKVTSVASGRGTAKTTFEVLDTLHSAFPLGKTVTIEHGTIGSMCGITFAPGKTYVVYAGGTSATTLGVGACSRTHLLTKGDADVAFAKQATARTTARIDGTVALSSGNDAKPIAGVEVRAGGKSARTNGKGAFTLDVPPGTYALAIGNADLRLWQGRAVEVTLPVAAACATPHLTVAYDGRIEGTVTGADGKPVADLEVGAIATNPAARSWRLSGRTDATGHYVIHEVPAGVFRVGVSVPEYGGTDVASPYPPTFYGKAITTKRAGLVSNIDLALPAGIKRVTFRCLVRRANGSAIPKAYVTITPAGKNRSTSGPADNQGVYQAIELAGEDVTINACEGGTCAQVTRTNIATDETIDFTLK